MDTPVIEGSRGELPVDDPRNVEPDAGAPDPFPTQGSKLLRGFLRLMQPKTTPPPPAIKLSPEETRLPQFPVTPPQPQATGLAARSRKVWVQPSDAWSTEPSTITDTAIRMVSKIDNRARVTIVNRDAANSVYISPQNSVSVTSGFEIKSGETLSFDTKAEIWAICDTGLTATIQTLSETFKQ